MLFPIGAPLIPSPYLQPLASYSTPNISGSRPWPFNVTWRRRSHDDSRYDSPYAVPYSCSVRTKSLSPSVFEIFGSKYIGFTTLTFWGHVTSLVMWPFDAPYSISYRSSIVTDSLSPAVFEILGPKHIWVTTLTFQSHLTSLDVIDRVTIRFPIWGFLLVLHWNKVPISKRFRDIWLQIYRNHDRDLLGSRDIIGH